MLGFGKSNGEDKVAKRERELSAIITDDRASTIARQNARERYFSEIPASVRLAASPRIIPTQDDIATALRECELIELRPVNSADEMRQREREAHEARQKLYERFPELAPAAAYCPPPPARPNFSQHREAKARQRLAEVIQAITKQTELVGSLLEPERQLGACREREDAAKAVLKAIDEAEHLAWDTWLTDTTKPQPLPRNADRAAALVEIEATSRATAIAEEAATKAREPYTKAVERLNELTKQRQLAISDVLAAILVDAAKAHRSLVHQVVAASGYTIHALRDQLQRHGGDPRALLRALEGDEQTQMAEARKLETLAQERVKALATELLTNADAILKSDGDGDV